MMTRNLIAFLGNTFAASSLFGAIIFTLAALIDFRKNKGKTPSDIRLGMAAVIYFALAAFLKVTALLLNNAHLFSAIR